MCDAGDYGGDDDVTLAFAQGVDHGLDAGDQERRKLLNKLQSVQSVLQSVQDSVALRAAGGEHGEVPRVEELLRDEEEDEDEDQKKKVTHDCDM